MIRILLADPDTLIKAGLRALAEQQPDMGGRGQAAEGSEMLEQAERFPPDLLVTEASLPKMDTLEARPASPGDGGLPS